MANKYYSDYELFELLENDGYETSYKNFAILKEGLNNGTIEIEEELSADEVYNILNEKADTSVLNNISCDVLEEVLEYAEYDDGISNLIENYYEDKIDLLEGIFSNIKKKLKGTGITMANGATDGAEKAGAALSTVGSKIKGAGETAANGVVAGAETLKKKIKDTGKAIANGAAAGTEKAGAALSTVGSKVLTPEVGHALIAAGVGAAAVGIPLLVWKMIKRIKEKRRLQALAQSQSIKESANVQEEIPAEEMPQEEVENEVLENTEEMPTDQPTEEEFSGEDQAVETPEMSSQIILSKDGELHVEKADTIIDKDAEGTISIQLAEQELEESKFGDFRLQQSKKRVERLQGKFGIGGTRTEKLVDKYKDGEISQEKAQERYDKGRKILDKAMKKDEQLQQKYGNSTPSTAVNTNESLSNFNSFKASRNMERLLHSYLTEDCGMLEEDYAVLTEETKTESIKEIAIELLKTIEEKVMSVDTTPADRSKGDIKQLKELPAIQDAIGNLETLLDRNSDTVPGAYSEAVNVIIKSILYINQYSQVFKDAYRNKKSLMIMKYESLVLSLISSITYLLSTIVTYDSNGAKIKLGADDIMNFAPIISLKAFVKSVDNGEFKTVVNDTTIMREFYLEIPVSTMGNILEAYEYIPMIVDGIKNIYSNLANGEGGRLLNILYKAAGVFVLLFSLRDTLYTLFKMKTKVSDMINAIQTFANVNNAGGGVLSKLGQFANRFTTDAEFGSDISKREIEDENKKLFTQVKNIQNDKSMPVVEPKEETETKSTVQPDDGAFGFDF